MNNFENIHQILKRAIPGYIDSEFDEEKETIIVTVPKADSMFFRENEEFPLLQQIPTLKREGINILTNYEIIDIDEENSQYIFKFESIQKEGFDWRSYLEIPEPKENISEDGFDSNMDFIRHILQGKT